MKKAKLLAGAVFVVAALLGGLLWATRHDSSTPRTAVAPTYEPAASDAPRPPLLQPSRQARPQPEADRPATPVEPNPYDRNTPDPNRVVHDHSGEGQKAARSPLAPTTIVAVRQAVTPLMDTCAEKLPRSGTPITTTVVARVTVAGGKLAVSDPVISHPAFKDAAFDECVTRAYAQLAMDAPVGQTDTTYRIAQPFKWE